MAVCVVVCCSHRCFYIRHGARTQHGGGKGAPVKSLPGFDNTHAPCLLVNRSSHVTPRAEPRDRIVCERTKSDTALRSASIGQVNGSVSWQPTLSAPTWSRLYSFVYVSERVWPLELLMPEPRIGPFGGASTTEERRTAFVSLNLARQFVAAATPDLTFQAGILR